MLNTVTEQIKEVYFCLRGLEHIMSQQASYGVGACGNCTYCQETEAYFALISANENNFVC